ncbi:MAG: DUF2288 domain-containing protein [Halothiobacillaceae bacterium]
MAEHAEAETLTLREQLGCETGRVSWRELERFFARGLVVEVDPGLSLLEVAEAMAEDDRARFAAWMRDGLVGPMADERARALSSREPELWAVVVAPWVLVQERVIH